MTLMRDLKDDRTYSFLFLRHAESEANHKKILSGSGEDSPLTPKGREQARQVGAMIRAARHLHPSKIYCSPMTRARETAALVTEHLAVPVTHHHAFTEQHLGVWEGTASWDEALKHFEQRTNPEKGEGYQDLYKRVYAWLQVILEHATLPLIISHGGVWHALRALVGDFSTDWPGNAALYRVQISQASGFVSEKIFVP